MSERPPPGRAIRSHDQKRRRHRIGEDPLRAIDPEFRVDHHPNRMTACAATNGELRIVVKNGIHPHQHRVGERTHPMGMQQIFVTTQPSRDATHRGNAPVQALCQMGNGKALMKGHRTERAVQGIEQRVIGMRHRPVRARSSRRRHAREGWVSVPHGEQGPPGGAVNSRRLRRQTLTQRKLLCDRIHRGLRCRLSTGAGLKSANT